MAIPWHRLFGMALTQYLAGTSWRVEVEVDLSVQQQRLDVVVVRREGEGVPVNWPDGFGPPADHNLISFRAGDPLSAWTLKELSAHSVAYRKLVSPHPDKLLPESKFRLLACAMHFPRDLASRIALQPIGPGAYDVQWGLDTIRILVFPDIPEAEQNVVWNLFSGDATRIATAFRRLGPRLQTWSSVLNLLLTSYGLEGMAMPYTMEDFERDAAKEFLQRLTPEQRLQGLSAEQLLQRLQPDERLQGLSDEQLRHLQAEIERRLTEHKERTDH